MFNVGGKCYCRVNEYIRYDTVWKVERFDSDHWVMRSQDSFEIEVYVSEGGRHIGSRELGWYETPVNVFMVPIL